MNLPTDKKHTCSPFGLKNQILSDRGGNHETSHTWYFSNRCSAVGSNGSHGGCASSQNNSLTSSQASGRCRNPKADHKSHPDTHANEETGNPSCFNDSSQHFDGSACSDEETSNPSFFDNPSQHFDCCACGNEETGNPSFYGYPSQHQHTAQRKR